MHVIQRLVNPGSGPPTGDPGIIWNNSAGNESTCCFILIQKVVLLLVCSVLLCWNNFGEFDFLLGVTVPRTAARSHGERGGAGHARRA